MIEFGIEIVGYGMVVIGSLFILILTFSISWYSLMRILRWLRGAWKVKSFWRQVDEAIPED
jgi:hypothetical protein